MSSSSNGSAVYNILAFAFVGQDTAGQTLSDIKYSGVLAGYQIVAEAVVEQDQNGKVHVHQPGKGGKGAVIGGAIGGVLGLIGGPAGVLGLAAAGAAIGGTAGHFDRVIPQDDLEELGAALTPDTSALLVMLEDTYSEGVIDSMGGYNANVVTLTVGDDLSGEIAQYASGSVTTPDGTVSTGDDGVVVGVDDAGDVVVTDAAGDVAVEDPEGDIAVEDPEGDVAVSPA